MVALVGLAGCGCRDAKLPGALALPAIALCVLSFGWPVALGRTIGAFAIIAIRTRARSQSHLASSEPDEPQPFEALAELIPTTLAAVLLRDIVAHVATVIGAAPPALAAEVAIGALLGWMLPCATAGIAVAAAFHGSSPAVTIGILATCGLVRHARQSRAIPHDVPNHPGFAFAVVGVALGVVACGGATGFVSPRLAVLLGIGSVLAWAFVVRPVPGVRPRWLVPIVLFGAIMAGSPTPTPRANETTLEDAFPGEALVFTGRAHRFGGRTILERSTITCCRIDARSIAIELDTALPVATGAWVAASGTLARDGDGRLRLGVAKGTWRAIAPPHDPFAYR